MGCGANPSGFLVEGREERDEAGEEEGWDSGAWMGSQRQRELQADPGEGRAGWAKEAVNLAPPLWPGGAGTGQVRLSPTPLKTTHRVWSTGKKVVCRPAVSTRRRALLENRRVYFISYLLTFS